MKPMNVKCSTGWATKTPFYAEVPLKCIESILEWFIWSFIFWQVFAEGSEQEVILSDAKMTIKAVDDVEGRYLSLEVEHQILQPGQDLKATLRDITPPNAARPTFYYLLVY